MSGPGAPSEYRGPALCVGARRFSPALFLSGPGALCRGPALFVSGPGARSECRARRSLCRGPALFVSGPGAPCVGAPCVGDRRCRGSALRPGAPLRRLALEGPGDCVWSGAFCRGLCRGPAVLFRLCLCRGPALCVGARRSLCRGPALLASEPGALCRGPAVHSQDFIFQISAVSVGSGAYCLPV